tara:strand:+ start:186 stop:299 length:114 start_codon:yes stop_codon:yes gene_type:complete
MLSVGNGRGINKKALLKRALMTLTDDMGYVIGGGGGN